MPFYMWQAAYTAEGTKGLIKEGGTKRRATIQKMLDGLGGKLVALYFAFGEYDIVGIVEFPDHTSATAASLAVNSTGMVTVRSIVLLTPEEVDAAVKKSVTYRPPGA